MFWGLLPGFLSHTLLMIHTKLRSLDFQVENIYSIFHLYTCNVHSAVLLNFRRGFSNISTAASILVCAVAFSVLLLFLKIGDNSPSVFVIAL